MVKRSSLLCKKKNTFDYTLTLSLCPQISNKYKNRIWFVNLTKPLKLNSIVNSGHSIYDLPSLPFKYLSRTIAVYYVKLL